MLERVSSNILLTILLGLGVIAFPTSTADGVSESEVRITGSIIPDLTGPIALTFRLESNSTIIGVLLLYTNSQGARTSEVMSLVGGNQTNGWWKASIVPRVLYETDLVGCVTTYRLDPVALQVTTDSSTDELPVAHDFRHGSNVCTDDELRSVGRWVMRVGWVFLAGIVGTWGATAYYMRIGRKQRTPSRPTAQMSSKTVAGNARGKRFAKKLVERPLAAILSLSGATGLLLYFGLSVLGTLSLSGATPLLFFSLLYAPWTPFALVGLLLFVLNLVKSSDSIRTVERCGAIITWGLTAWLFVIVYPDLVKHENFLYLPGLYTQTAATTLAGVLLFAAGLLDSGRKPRRTDDSIP